MNQLSNRLRVLYGSGDLGFSISNTAIGAFFAIFLTDTVGVHASFAALIILIGGVWDAFTDPVMGILSDRTRSAFGRRRPFLLFGAIPFAIFYILLWVAPGNRSILFTSIYYPLMLILFQTSSTIIYVPFLSLTPELSADYDERNALTSNRMIFSIVGSLLVFTLPMTFIGEFLPGTASRVQIVGLISALACIIPFVLIGIFIREKKQTQIVERPGILKSIKIVARNKAFMWALLLLLFSWLAIEVVQALLIYFIKYRLGRPMQSDLIMAAVFVSALLSLPFWNLFSRRFDKRAGFLFGVFLWLGMQIIFISFSAATPLALILPVCVFAGIGVGSVHVFSWSMIPDGIDMGDAEGKSQEGLYYSVVTFMRKLASKATVFLVLFILGQSGYEANALQQSPAADTALNLLFGPLPALLLVIAIFAAYRYPVRRSDIKTAELPGD